MHRIESARSRHRQRVAVRRGALLIIATLVGVVTASAQTQDSDDHPYGLDPYKPSDAALLRDYGNTLVAQTPFSELRKLDPYKPSHAALLRDIGGAMPLWGILWYPGPVPASTLPFPPQHVFDRSADKGFQARRDERTDAATTSALTAVAAPPSTSMTTLRAPESNDGVWIVFANQKWISAGQTVKFDEPQFQQVGQYDGFPVYKGIGAREDVIYLPTREGAVAPYRLKP
jgi:hypothetical protein